MTHASHWKNWSENQSQTENVVVVRPTSVEELRGFMAQAVTEKRKIRCAGTTHAWAELIANDGQPLMVVDMTTWSGPVELDLADNTATMPAGMNMREVTKILAKKGYLLLSPPIYEGMNMGGTLATATHGTGDGRTETMSDHLVGFKMMLPDQSIVMIDKDQKLSDEDAELLKAVRSSLGALGVVFEITLRVTANRFVRQKDYLVPVEDALDQVAETVEQNEFVEWLWMPFTDTMWLKTYGAVPRVRYFFLKRWWWVFKWKVLTLFQGTVYPWLLARRTPLKKQWRTRPFLRTLARLIPLGDVVVPANDALHFQKALPKIIAIAWTVRQDQIAELWRFLMARIRGQELSARYPCNVAVESRFINRSAEFHGVGDEYVPSVLLSPAVFDKTAYVEVVGHYQTEGMSEFFDELDKGVYENFSESRPHFGKYFRYGKYLADRYNRNPESGQEHWRMARFLRVRKALDPEHTMSNAFLDDEVFTGPEHPPPGFDALHGARFRGHSEVQP